MISSASNACCRERSIKFLGLSPSPTSIALSAPCALETIANAPCSPARAATLQFPRSSIVRIPAASESRAHLFPNVRVPYVPRYQRRGSLRHFLQSRDRPIARFLRSRVPPCGVLLIPDE